jgi:hypothetical protein
MIKRLSLRRAALASLLAAATINTIVTGKASAGIVINAASNSVSNAGGFSYDGVQSNNAFSNASSNSAVNAAATVNDTFGPEPGGLYLHAEASAMIGTDSSTYFFVEGSAASYANSGSTAVAASVLASAYSQVEFTLTTQSTATLFIQAYATTNDPGSGSGNYVQIQMFLYDGNNSFYADAISLVGFNQENHAYIPLTLDAGNYMLSYASLYTYGDVQNANGVADQYAYGIAKLYDITPVTTAEIAVPEPTSCVLWSVVAGIFGIGSLRKRLKRTEVSA